MKVSVASKSDFSKLSDEEKSRILSELENAAIQRLVDGILANGLIKYELVEDKEHKITATATLGVYDIEEMAAVPEESQAKKSGKKAIRS